MQMYFYLCSCCTLCCSSKVALGLVLLETGPTNGLFSGTGLRGSGTDGSWEGGLGVATELEGFGVVLEFEEFWGTLEFEAF